MSHSRWLKNSRVKWPPRSRSTMRLPVSSASVPASVPPAAPEPTIKMSHAISVTVGSAPSATLEQRTVVTDVAPDCGQRIGGDHHERLGRAIEAPAQAERAARPELQVLPLGRERCAAEARDFCQRARSTEGAGVARLHAFELAIDGGFCEATRGE